MQLDFHNRVAVITGAARGLGAATAEAFYRAGAKVALLDLSGEECLKMAETIDPGGSHVAAHEVDIVEYDRVCKTVDKILTDFRRIDILVNNAGILQHIPIEEKTVADFEKVVRVNLSGAFIMCKAVVPTMKKQKYGKIVNMSTLGARTGRPGSSSAPGCCRSRPGPQRNCRRRRTSGCGGCRCRPRTRRPRCPG